MNQILLVDKVFQPLRTISRQRALKLNFLNKASFLIPEILQLLHYAHFKRVPLRFTKKSVYFRDDYTCQYCGCALHKSRITIDHIIPVSRGGKSTFLNCVSACVKCNVKKSNKLPQEAGMNLIKNVTEPSHYELLKGQAKELLDRFQQYLNSEIN